MAHFATHKRSPHVFWERTLVFVWARQIDQDRVFFLHQREFIFGRLWRQENTRFIQHARKKVIYNPQHLQVVILECSVKGILPAGLMWCAFTTKDTQLVCYGARESRHRGITMMRIEVNSHGWKTGTFRRAATNFLPWKIYLLTFLPSYMSKRWAVRAWKTSSATR